MAIENKISETKRTNHEEEKIKKTKRNKLEKIPKYKIDDEIILSEGYGKRHYFKVQIIDVDSVCSDFIYYAIILKTTDKRYLDRINHLVHFSEDGHFWGKTIEYIIDKNIQWVTKF